ncbi:transposase, IS4 family [Desulforamulus putei DSM 12395]|uniref:Transposase, IS4 family n=1 Tax=Desulforamulus putei DSM 12395 TaxID=1121429 RepID=A0A1M5DG77_9FIRM|nr:transposase, IS4 family [Desulforamulus putei DSM 12395]
MHFPIFTSGVLHEKLKNKTKNKNDDKQTIFVIEQGNEDLTTHSGLALIGALLANTKLKTRLNKTMATEQKNPHISNGSVAIAYIGLLCQGKSDFDHVEPFREDNFFSISLNIKETPSSPTLRQRLDMVAKDGTWNNILLEESAELIKKTNAPLTPVYLGRENRAYIPLDIDVSPFDNSNTKKEGVSGTYKGTDGYAPIFAYLGREGYCVNTELRQGSEHCQKNTTEFIAESIRYAKKITQEPLLLRMDSGNDSTDNIRICLNDDTKADFIIKRNLRKETPEGWLLLAKNNKDIYCQEREGKKVYYGSMMKYKKKLNREIRLVYKVTERASDAKGQMFLVPQVEAETYWTLLPDLPHEIEKLYHEHGTSEQFHSELKTDLDYLVSCDFTPVFFCCSMPVLY